MATSHSDDDEIAHVREVLAVTEATLDAMIGELERAADHLAEVDAASGAVPTRVTDERITALCDEIARLRQRIEQFKGLS